MTPVQLEDVPTLIQGQPDDVLLISASWEPRCLGVPELIKKYSCHNVLLTVYDGESSLREANIAKMTPLLSRVAPIKTIEAKHVDPLANVRETIRWLKSNVNGIPRLTFDVSTFTRKHLLQLLQGLDLTGLLGKSQFLHTEPTDFVTSDNDALSEGVSSVRAIETFAGEKTPSRDTVLTLFLGYEGRRAQALVENLEPNITLAVIADPPYRPEWKSRAEEQNRYLLSCLPRRNVIRAHSLEPASSEHLLERTISQDHFPPETYNHFIAPMGTKPQTLGVYRFVRKHRGLATLVYASPSRYKEERAVFPAGRTWLVDKSEHW